MLGWFNSIKEKSKEVVQLYKNEISNMVYQLDDDIKTLKTNIKNNKEEQQQEKQVEQEMSSIKSDEKLSSEQEKLQQKRNAVVNLLNLLTEYESSIQNNEENIEFLNEQIEFIENSLQSYFAKDPKQLIMIERDDFTNFHVFEDTANIQQQIQKLSQTGAIRNLPIDTQIQKRVLYFLIYQFHEKIQYSVEQQQQSLNDVKQQTSNQVQISEQEADNQQFLNEDPNIISQDLIEEQEEGSNTKIQKRKSSQQNSNKDEDNWEIDDNMIAI
ncbi:hypothetical protein ABPG74_010293 [Tetrahymena malaccensis]